MNVRELIQILEGFDQELEVIYEVEDIYSFLDVTEIEPVLAVPLSDLWLARSIEQYSAVREIDELDEYPPKEKEYLCLN